MSAWHGGGTAGSPAGPPFPSALPPSSCPPAPRRLRLFQKFSTFRILVCGGDGSVGWVLSEIDALGLHKQVSPPFPPPPPPFPSSSPPGGTAAPKGARLSLPVPVPQCQLGVLPLGTGNDLARVLGWGSLCDDDTQLLQILEKLERATTKMLDR